MGVTPGSLTTVKSDKKICWKNYLKILAGNKINKLIDSGFKIGNSESNTDLIIILSRGCQPFLYKSFLICSLLDYFPAFTTARTNQTYHSVLFVPYNY